ncbi:MAG: peptidylprolyl isomerase [Candidatus Cloacimonetes bacterium]|nr:peptidylprolyl isomerase [Candidatus Cloacimonadota bacterium]
MSSDAVIVINNKKILDSDVLIYLKAKSEYRKAVSELIMRFALKDYADKNNIEVTSNELQKFSEKRRQELKLFSVKDTNSYFNYLGIDFEQWADELEIEFLENKIKDIVITDEIIEKYYRNNLSRFLEIELWKIAVEDKNSAEEIIEELEKAGTDNIADVFSELAEDCSVDLDTYRKAGAMGFIKRGVLSAEAEALAFSNSVNSIIGPFPENKLWAIYRTGETKNSELTDELRQTIKDGLFDLWKNDLLNSVKVEAPE